MKYKIIYLFSLLVYLFTLCSCTDTKSKKPVSTVSMGMLKHSTIDTGENFIGHGGRLAICQDTIIGIEGGNTSSIPPFFCLKPDGALHTLYHFATRGQGPDDFLNPYSLQRIDNNILGTFDMNVRAYIEFAIPSENEKFRINKRIRFEAKQPTKVIKTAFNQYIDLLALDDAMFLLADSTGKTVNTYFEYPYKNNDERQRFDNKTRFFAYQGDLAANPSKTKFAYAASKSDIIHFYDIKNNDIQLITKIENGYPLYQPFDVPNYTGVSLDKDGQRGYLGIYATEQFVYALFSGENMEDSAGKGAKRLRVFDWDGNLLKEYELDVPSLHLCVSDDDSKLWTIALNPDPELVYFDLLT